MSRQTDEHASFKSIFRLQRTNGKQTNVKEEEDCVNNKEPVWTHNVIIRTNNEKSQMFNEKVGTFGTPLLQKTTHVMNCYDPHDFGNSMKPTSFRSTVIHLIIISAGPPLLSIPISFLKVGYAVGLLSILLSTSLYAYSMHTLLWSEYEICKLKRIPHLTYPDLIYFAFQDGPPRLRWFSKIGGRIVDVVFITFWTSACCYNLAMSAENIRIVSNHRTTKNVDVHVVMVCIFLPVLFLCWMPKLKHLVPVSLAANLANLLCIGVVIYDVIFSEESFKGIPAFGSLTQLPFFLGTIFFTLNATGLMLPLKKEMEEPGRFNSACGILTATYIPVCLMYAVFGPLCAFKYGSSVKDSVTQNVQQGHLSLLTECMMLANALTLILQYPLFTYIIFDVIRNSLVKGNRKLLTGSVIKECSLKTVITITIFLITYLLPSVKLFLTFGGAVGTMIDSLLLPAFVQTVVMWKVSNSKKIFYRCLYKNILISVLAVGLMISGGVSCVQDILWHYNTKNTGS